jgi:hypothetical protein
VLFGVRVPLKRETWLRNHSILRIDEAKIWAAVAMEEQNLDLGKKTAKSAEAIWQRAKLTLIPEMVVECSHHRKEGVYIIPCSNMNSI